MMLGHNRKMSGAECMADMLKGYGVTHVFHVPAVLRKTFAVMESRTKIKRLHVHGEKSAAYMADGYARASGKPGICMAQVIGALNLAAGLRDAWLAHSPVIAMTGGREPKTQVPQGLSGGRRRAGVRAGDQVQRHGRRRARAFPTWCGRRSASRPPARPGRCICNSAATRARSTPRRRRWSRWCEPQFARVPPFRPEPDQASVLAALKVLQEAQRPVIVAGGGVRASGAGARTGRAGGGVANSGRDLAQRQGFDPRQPSAVGRRRRHLFARERQPGRQRGRSRLLHRQRDRRHDHAFLGGAEDRHAGDPDRHRSGGARPELSVAGRASTATPR